MSPALRGLASVVIGGSVVACAERVPEPAEPRHVQPAVIAPTPVVGEPVAAVESFCGSLAGLLTEEAEAYRGIRGTAVAPGTWRATRTLAGSERCTVEGAARPLALVSCEGPVHDAADPGRALVAFDRMAEEIDRCLARPSFFPRDFERGELFEFAMNERQIAWLDRSAVPPTAVVLKVQQDLVSRDYRIRINLESAP